MLCRKFWLIQIILLYLAHSLTTQAQVRFSNEFSNSRIHFVDGSIEEVSLNSYLLFAKNQLVSDQTNNRITISKIKWIEIDSVQYAIGVVNNSKPDSIRVLEPIVVGTVSLYRSPRLSGKSDLFISKDKKVYHLRTVKKYIDQSNIKITKEYIYILRSLMIGCSQIKPIADNLSLNIKSIQNIVLAYNTSCGQLDKLPIAKKRSEIKFQGGLSAGYSFSNPDLLYFEGSEYVGKSSLSRPFFGVFVRLDFGKFSRTMLTYDLVYENVTGEGSSYSATDPTKMILSTFKYDNHQIRNQLAVNFKIIKRESVNIYAGAGFSIQYQLSNDSKQKLFNSPRLISAKSYNDLINISPMINLGVSTGKFEVKYQLLALVLNLKSFESQSIEHRISIGYTIF